ncbi:hypothetical protein P364_0111975 [Paenibacillus sp. MAEPY2]|nr:hypothetical protein P364_0111975 [Paenibacillus sp. MAEPY2]KGP89288.1 hypothetical protein P363_0103010 [Paenibacillus sp. MAEPY1]
MNDVGTFLLYLQTDKNSSELTLETSVPTSSFTNFATHMHNTSCDMALVPNYLVHTEIAATKIYAKVSQKNE